jgi:lipopolysaccharide transport system ATP-binding protein
VLGIIGANGAGKSTLLKILSRITAPTHGEVRIKGRIASLLEIGTGFHPDLTGRENIFLNGAIMGMSRGEIRKKSDEIIDFSGVEEFIDSPVKRYSSGMYVRLAFAVAAHLDPDILLLDEVLSVGDIGFQAKCYNKISAFRKQGTAFILVSHNMLQITRFCTNVLYLRKGQVVYLGPTDGGVELFRQEMAAQAQDMTIGNASGIEESGSMAVRIEEPFFANPQGEPVTEISSDEPVCLVMPYRCRNEPVSNPVLELGFRDASREILFHGSNRISAANLGVLQGTGRLVVHFDAIPANNQMLITSIALWNASMQELLYWRRGVKLKVRGHPKATGRILLQCRWSHVRTEKPVRSCESSA